MDLFQQNKIKNYPAILKKLNDKSPFDINILLI